MNPQPNPVSIRILGYLYMLTMAGAMTFAVLWMTSPGFRYWLFRKGRELQYQWASWEYKMRTEPIPDWAQQMTREADLPPEIGPE